MTEKIDILGVDISNITFSEGLELVKQWVVKEQEKHFIVTPNPEIVMRAQRDGRFKEILNKADLAICDGVGLYLAGKIFKTPFKSRISGIDFMLGLCSMAEKAGFSIGLLGAGKGIAEESAKQLKKEFPNLKIFFIGEEWPEGIAPDRGIDILFVAFGAPKQEEWMSNNLGKIPVKISMGVGGSFDYIAGKIRRAPRLMRIIGGEWLFRLFKEPWRIGRQKAIWQFFLLILKNKIRTIFFH